MFLRLPITAATPKPKNTLHVNCKDCEDCSGLASDLLKIGKSLTEISKRLDVCLALRQVFDIAESEPVRTASKAISARDDIGREESLTVYSQLRRCENHAEETDRKYECKDAHHQTALVDDWLEEA